MESEQEAEAISHLVKTPLTNTSLHSNIPLHYYSYMHVRLQLKGLIQNETVTCIEDLNMIRLCLENPTSIEKLFGN